MITPEQFEEIRQRAEKATSGPWLGNNEGCFVDGDDADGVCTVHNHGTRSWSRVVATPAHGHAGAEDSEAHRNMEFIAHARTDIPALLAALEEVTKERDHWQHEYEESHKVKVHVMGQRHELKIQLSAERAYSHCLLNLIKEAKDYYFSDLEGRGEPEFSQIEFAYGAIETLLQKATALSREK